MLGINDGSGLRSQGGIKSGLEVPDLLGLLVHADGVWSKPSIGAAKWLFGTRSSDWLASARGGVLAERAGELEGCDNTSAPSDLSGISDGSSSVPSGGSCPPRCMRMWCWSTRALVNLRWHSGHEF